MPIFLEQTNTKTPIPNPSIGEISQTIQDESHFIAAMIYANTTNVIAVTQGHSPPLQRIQEPIELEAGFAFPREH